MLHTKKIIIFRNVKDSLFTLNLTSTVVLELLMFSALKIWYFMMLKT